MSEHMGERVAAMVEASAMSERKDFEAICEWLGDMDESRNVFAVTDEATTVISIDVEVLAQRLVAAGLARGALGNSLRGAVRRVLDAERAWSGDPDESGPLMEAVHRLGDAYDNVGGVR